MHAPDTYSPQQAHLPGPIPSRGLPFARRHRSPRCIENAVGVNPGRGGAPTLKRPRRNHAARSTMPCIPTAPTSPWPAQPIAKPTPHAHAHYGLDGARPSHTRTRHVPVGSVPVGTDHYPHHRVTPSAATPRATPRRELPHESARVGGTGSLPRGTPISPTPSYYRPALVLAGPLPLLQHSLIHDAHQPHEDADVVMECVHLAIAQGSRASLDHRFRRLRAVPADVLEPGSQWPKQTSDEGGGGGGEASKQADRNEERAHEEAGSSSG